MDKGPYYLASPQKGTKAQETYRFEVSLKLTTQFLIQGIHVFSPVVYTNSLSAALTFLPTEERRKWVMTYLLDFLKVSKGLILIKLEGWQESWGVQQELKFCQQHMIPVYIIDLDQIPSDLSKILHNPLNQDQLNQLLSKVIGYIPAS